MSKNFVFFTILFLATACQSSKEPEEIPSWYLTPQQNNSSFLYGSAEGGSKEEATRFALADLAARLAVSISSESNLIREENQNSANEEMRQNVRQKISEISFNNFAVSNSAKLGSKYYAEVKIERQNFLNQQQEDLNFTQKKLSNLEKNLSKQNPLQKRSSLLEALQIAKKAELIARILQGLGVDANLNKKLDDVANLENEVALTLNNLEFVFNKNADAKITQILRYNLNNEKIAVAKNYNPNNANQILIKISQRHSTEKIYNNFITKLNIDFDNILQGKSIAANSIEVSGSSVINQEQSYNAALISLKEKIAKDGVFQTIGILN